MSSATPDFMCCCKWQLRHLELDNYIEQDEDSRNERDERIERNHTSSGLARFLGTLELSTLVSLSLGCCCLSSSVFGHLTSLTGLHSLDLSCSELPDNCFEVVNRLKSLKELNISSTGLSALPPIKGLGLTSLNLSHNPLDYQSDAGHAAALTLAQGLASTLRRLELAGTGLTAQNLAYFTCLTQLRKLSIGDNELSLALGEVTTNFSSLRFLDLAYSEIPNISHLEFIRELTNLRKLNINLPTLSLSNDMLLPIVQDLKQLRKIWIAPQHDTPFISNSLGRAQVLSWPNEISPRIQLDCNVWVMGLQDNASVLLRKMLASGLARSVPSRSSSSEEGEVAGTTSTTTPSPTPFPLERTGLKAMVSSSPCRFLLDEVILKQGERQVDESQRDNYLNGADPEVLLWAVDSTDPPLLLQAGGRALGAVLAQLQRIKFLLVVAMGRDRRADNSHVGSIAAHLGLADLSPGNQPVRQQLPYLLISLMDEEEEAEDTREEEEEMQSSDADNSLHLLISAFQWLTEYLMNMKQQET